jgi:hypothetical protein
MGFFNTIPANVANKEKANPNTENALNLKYRKDIDALQLSDCPQKNSIAKESEAFRYCYDDPAHPDTWVTQAEKLKRKGSFPRKNANDNSMCSDFGLSFFVSEEMAKNTWTCFPSKMKKAMGYTKIMIGSVTKTDGVCTPPSHQGHFNLHEYEHCNLVTRFKILSAL